MKRRATQPDLLSKHVYDTTQTGRRTEAKTGRVRMLMLLALVLGIALLW